MKKQTKPLLKLNKFKISQLAVTNHINGGTNGNSIYCTDISLIICSLPTDPNADANYVTTD